MLKFKTHIVLRQRIVEGYYTGFIAVLANKWDCDSFLHVNVIFRCNLFCFHIIIIVQHILKYKSYPDLDLKSWVFFSVQLAPGLCEKLGRQYIWLYRYRSC